MSIPGSSFPHKFGGSLSRKGPPLTLALADRNLSTLAAQIPTCSLHLNATKPARAETACRGDFHEKWKVQSGGEGAGPGGEGRQGRKASAV